MTGHGSEQPPGRRLFVAVPIPAVVGEAVAGLVERVRAEADPALHDVRWVRLEGLHVTLRFLGPTDEEHVPDVAAAVDRAARQIEPFEVEIAGAGAFPSAGRPRALWLGIGGGSADLAAATAVLGDELAIAGWARDERPFQAHLTLARSDGVRAGADVARRLVDAAGDFRRVFKAAALTVFESRSGRGPARYVALHESHLG